MSQKRQWELDGVAFPCSMATGDAFARKAGAGHWMSLNSGVSVAKHACYVERQREKIISLRKEVHAVG